MSVKEVTKWEGREEGVDTSDAKSVENVSLNCDNRLVIFGEYENVVTNSFSSTENSPDKVSPGQVVGIDLLFFHRQKFN